MNNQSFHKNSIYEITGFTEKFWKSTMENPYLPKLSILLQFQDEILALLCFSDFCFFENSLRKLCYKKSVYTQTSHLLHIILPIQSLPIWFLPYENKRKEKQSFYAEV